MASGLVDAWIVTHTKEGRALPVPGALPRGEGWELAAAVGPFPATMQDIWSRIYSEWFP